MIVRDKLTLGDLVLASRGSIVPRIASRVALMVAVATVMTVLGRTFPGLPPAGDAAFTVFGIALSLFLGFRNNAAYDRWWEARKLWGGLLADMRSLARETEVFIGNPALREEVLRLALAFLHLHRTNLRKLPEDAEATARGGDLARAAHPPDAALDRLAGLLADAHRAGTIDGFGARALTERVASIALQQAGCERIVATPLPFVYSLLIHRTVWLYCLLLPLALIGPVGWLTPLFVGIVGYVFLGLAEVSRELAQPFGLSDNGLPLDAICRAAEISLAPHLGEDPPPPLAPRDYFLS